MSKSQITIVYEDCGDLRYKVVFTEQEVDKWLEENNLKAIVIRGRITDIQDRT